MIEANSNVIAAILREMRVSNASHCGGLCNGVCAIPAQLDLSERSLDRNDGKRCLSMQQLTGSSLR